VRALTDEEKTDLAEQIIQEQKRKGSIVMVLYFVICSFFVVFVNVDSLSRVQLLWNLGTDIAGLADGRKVDSA